MKVGAALVAVAVSCSFVFIVSSSASYCLVYMFGGLYDNASLFDGTGRHLIRSFAFSFDHVISARGFQGIRKMPLKSLLAFPIFLSLPFVMMSVVFGLVASWLAILFRARYDLSVFLFFLAMLASLVDLSVSFFSLPANLPGAFVVVSFLSVASAWIAVPVSGAWAFATMFREIHPKASMVTNLSNSELLSGLLFENWLDEEG